MNAIVQKRQRFHQRQRRVRAKFIGTAQRPRLTVQRSLKHLCCQLIDDTTGRTLAAATDETVAKTGKKITKAQAVGQAIAAAAQQLGITTVVFDRSGYRYHGRVKALAEAARAGGLQF